MKGSTVEDLHKTWGFSASVVELLTAGRSFNLVALAALTAKLALIDNLLLQRAAGSVAGTFTRKDVMIRLPVVPQLPEGYGGEFGGDGSAGVLSDDFSLDLFHYATVGDVVLFNDTWNFDWNNKTKTAMSTFHTGCEGICEATIQGFGFRVDCAESIISPTFSMHHTCNRIREHAGFQGQLDGLQPNLTGYRPELFTHNPVGECYCSVSGRVLSSLLGNKSQCYVR